MPAFRHLPELDNDVRVVHRDGTFVVRRDWSLEFDERARELCPYQVVGFRAEPYPPPPWLGGATCSFRADTPRAHLELEFRDPLVEDPTRIFERHYSLIRIEHLDAEAA